MVKGILSVKGIVRRLDDLGRVVIPKEMRRSLGIENSDLVDIYLKDEVVCIRSVQLQCALCGSREEDQLIQVNGVHICNGCVESIREALS